MGMSTPPRIEPLPELKWDPEVSALLRRQGALEAADRELVPAAPRFPAVGGDRT